MEKRIFLVAFFLIFLIGFVHLTKADFYEAEQNAYDCVLSQVEGSNCDDVSSLEDQIFALMATQQCLGQVMDASRNNGEFWPSSSGSSSLEMTAKALIGLEQTNQDTEKIENYLLGKTKTPPGMEWFIQVESNEQANCEVTYGTNTYNFVLKEDKTISNLQSNTCLSPYSQDSSIQPYWLKINPSESCLENTYEISCDKGISSNLLYKGENSNVIYVGVETNQASADEALSEKVTSKCFYEGGECSFEASLWATLALDSAGVDVSNFLPYLVSETSLEDYNDVNTEFLPQAFIYHLKEYPEYWNYLKQIQSPQGYWDESGNPFYDTAIALLPFSGEFRPEKELAKEWLISNNIQKPSGCWGSGSKGNVGDTAFLLFSIFGPRGDLAPECTEATEDDDCASDEECKFGFCVPQGSECAEDRHCNGGVCIDNSCEECRYDDDCSGDLICVASEDYTCHECGTDSDCVALIGEGYGCTDDLKCERLPECDDDNPCESGECVGGFCMGGIECSENSECTQENKPICFNDSCVECGQKSDCDGQDYLCVDHECIIDGGDDLDCEDQGFFCRSSWGCTHDDGEILDEYDCVGTKICCDKEEVQQTCADLDGIICKTNENCEGGEIGNSATDVLSNQVCCISGGKCVEVEDKNNCLKFNTDGACRSSCWDGETQTSDSCEDPLDYCCVPSTSSSSGGGGSGSIVWLVIFAILVVLVVLGMIFRDKLSLWFMQLKSKFGGSKGGAPRRPGFPPPRGGTPMNRPFPRRPRRIIAPQKRSPPPRRPKPSPKPSGELNDVLKKLKDIGK